MSLGDVRVTFFVIYPLIFYKSDTQLAFHKVNLPAICCNVVRKLCFEIRIKGELDI